MPHAHDDNLPLLRIMRKPHYIGRAAEWYDQLAQAESVAGSSALGKYGK